MVQITRAEEEAVWYAESVNWDYNEICEYIFNDIHHTRYSELIGSTANEKAEYIIKKYKPKMETKTKVTVLGEEPKKELKKIEFIKGMSADTSWKNNVCHVPSEYKEIILLERGYIYIENEYYDLMYCISEDNQPNLLMYGKFNDGIV